jgi:DNA invertase Pin-like site-specific DNA recombinase
LSGLFGIDALNLFIHRP